VTFADPNEKGRTWRIDVTFLLSRWDCIFGAGCQGVLETPAPELVQGCCSHGAHFSGRDDRDAIVKLARDLGPDEWQFAEVGRKKGIYASLGKDEDGTPEWRTRRVEGACIFLNRPDFPTGPGCALHQHAWRTGVHPSDTKPEVCWQLPLRRLDEQHEDGSVISTLTEFGRAGWGEGGDDFAWWCTEAPEAFVAKAPVYETLAEEIRKMIGKRLYRQVKTYLDARRAAAEVLPVVHHPSEVPVTLTRKTPSRSKSSRR